MSMMSENQLFGTVFNIFRDKLQLEVPSADTDLLEEGMMDSLKFVELVFQIEREFGVAVSMHTLELDQFRTVNSIVEFVAKAKRESSTMPLATN